VDPEDVAPDDVSDPGGVDPCGGADPGGTAPNGGSDPGDVVPVAGVASVVRVVSPEATPGEGGGPSVDVASPVRVDGAPATSPPAGAPPTGASTSEG
jgi:hypothetical protein